jgi:hypothetical protein
MFMMITRIIRAPRPNTIALLLRRMPPEAKQQIENRHFDAIGLIQTDLPSLFYYADLGQKAGNVIAVELIGNCPQHVNTVALLGSNEAVNAAITALHTTEKQKEI